MERNTHTEQWFKDHDFLIPCYRVDWTTVRGFDADVNVLAIPGLSVVAVPTTGRRNARQYDMIDMDGRELLCQLHRSEVNGWLYAVARSRAVPHNDVCR